MKRIIVTGANGSGKSHLAKRLAGARPDVPLVSFDAIKLKTDWQTKPRVQIEATLRREIEQDAWIVEGGPNLLPIAMKRADALVWLDPPELLRAWRLLTRPWKSRGQTRPELPAGNVDWPIEQYRFAITSLKNRKRFRANISTVFDAAEHTRNWHCKTRGDIEKALQTWALNEKCS